MESALSSIPLVGRGKVRDIYALDERQLLIVATDRLSAFDVVMRQPIPGKGSVLTALSSFWMARFSGLIENHVVRDVELSHYLRADELEQISGRSVVARKLWALPVEAVARGYLIGGGWKDYQATGAISDVVLPRGLELAAKLPEPIFTPAMKAPSGQHDENISFAKVESAVGTVLAARIREITLRLYTEAADYARARGIIIADTKFEFGVDEDGRLILIDEALTPDSSRFWSAMSYRPGSNPTSFDKQFVRDYLETLDWNKKAPAPLLPPEVVAKTAAKYREAQRSLMAS